jgi:hypothetical protein
MENTSIACFKNRFGGKWQALRAVKLTFWMLLLSLMVGLGNGCHKAEPNTPNPTATAPPPKVHVAMSGGGWRAHTAHAGWTISLLKNGGRTLQDAFANVSTIASNSGGSWFSTMLMFQPRFDAAIQARNAITTWGQTGWLGKQQHWFDEAGCDSSSGSEFLLCVAGKYTNDEELYWNNVVEQLVYKDYPIDRSITLSSPRQPWASDKTLLLAGTMLMNQVVLNEGSSWEKPKRFYQACPSPTTPVLNGYEGATCGGGATHDVTPVTFSSIHSGSRLVPPPFLPAIGTSGNPALINLGYTENDYRRPPVASNTIQNPLNNSQVPVVLAAAASSAAAGFGAMLGIFSDTWQGTYEVCDEAPSFQLSGSTVQSVDASGMSVNDLANNCIVRIADGGPVDNSGVIQLVSHLQRNNMADNFSIVAFDNVQELYNPVGRGAPIGVDLASLFTSICNGKFCSGSACNGTCVTIPALQVFAPSALQGTAVTWIDSTDGDSAVHKVIYTQYSVTTVANAAYGITAGTKGTLHAFTCAWSDADTAPQNNTQNGDFIAYNAMLQFIYAALQRNDGIGQKHLERAFGLIP